MATVLANVYDGLVRAVGSKVVTIVPDLATSWKESADGKTWTFKLRSGVKFHDGNTVDAAAVKFTFDRLIKLQTGAIGDFLEIASVDAPDPSTVVFHLSTSYFGLSAFPDHAVGPRDRQSEDRAGASGEGRPGQGLDGRTRRRLGTLDGQAMGSRPEDRPRPVPWLLEGLVGTARRRSRAAMAGGLQHPAPGSGTRRRRYRHEPELPGFRGRRP